MEKINSFLGTGWNFPPSFDRMNNAARMVSDITDIEESIQIILGTMPGERIMQPEFGCHIRKMVFEKIDAAFVNEVNDIIKYSLLHFEPRVKFIRAEVVQQDQWDGTVIIKVDFSVITTNTRHNVVYPFFKLEGTNITD
jgi:phage baseplate assembly protein W